MISAVKGHQVSANEVANYFVELASEQDENDLTNLKLQKLLYIAQVVHLAKKKSPLFKEPIEAWDLGPVVRSVYENFKSCGSFPITAFDKHVEESNLPGDVKKFISMIWEEYGKYSASHLVDITHEPSSPWDKVFTKGENKEIPLELMADYFSRMSS